MSPSDPLAALGPANFLHVLSFIDIPSLLGAESVCHPWKDVIDEYAKSVWRDACWRTGVPSKDMARLAYLDENPIPDDESYDEFPLPAAIGKTNAWKQACRSEVELQRNWKHGRCHEAWVTGAPDNSVWRIKEDPEEGTMLMTSRTGESPFRTSPLPAGGLTVIHIESSKLLFQVRGVRPWAHLEFAKGFAVFDIGPGQSYESAEPTNAVQMGLEVWQNGPSRSRCAERLPDQLSSLHASVHSFTDANYRHPASDSICHTFLRGHFTYFRTIQPPTCIAFRARIDQEGTSRERAVLATAGPTAICLWDLETGRNVFTAELQQESETRIKVSPLTLLSCYAE